MLTPKFWKKYFEEYDLLNVLMPYQDVLDEIVKESDIRQGDKVFDAGSGTGNLALKLEQKGAIVTALDYSREGLELHRRKTPNASVVHGDLTKSLPFEDGAFDKICSNNTIYTLSNDFYGKIFKEFFRILKPGGKIVISNPRKGFSPFKIYISHVKASMKKDGILKTFFTIVKLIVPTLKIFYYNYLIKKENREGSYTFFAEGEQSVLLKNAGFIDVSSDILAYADQAVLNSAIKPK